MITRRIRYWLRHGDRARGLAEEIEFHIDMRSRELPAAGMPDAEARARARQEFGNVTRVQEDSRATWIARWWGDLLQDPRDQRLLDDLRAARVTPCPIPTTAT